ncbi:MAG TPA: YdcF family protein [Acidimicrobiia bacterium]|nr:YdcF family protein [Acidimicrobiia bacterium]
MKERIRRVVRIALRVLGIVVVAMTVYLLVTFVQVWRAADRDGARPSDAIVVLGAAQYDGVPSPVLRARLDHAVDLYDDDIAPLIVVTGGRREGDRFTEATAAATYLHTRGVPDDAILRETTGSSSWESLAATARILDDRGLDRVVLVSDPYHSARIDLIADEVGLDAVTSPTRTSPISGFAQWRRFGTETLRVAVGRIIGFDRLERSRDDLEELEELGAIGTPLAMLAGSSRPVHGSVATTSVRG